TDNHEPVVFHKQQHAPAIVNSEYAFDVITQRTRNHHCQQKLPTRILQRARSRDKYLERQRRRKNCGNSDREKPKPLVRVLDSLDTLQWKALPQHRLAAAANDRIKKITTDHAS